MVEVSNWGVPLVKLKIAAPTPSYVLYLGTEVYQLGSEFGYMDQKTQVLVV